MPNLGQGGGMAIEDALVLGQELRPELLTRGGPAVPLALGRYQQNRVVRAAAVQGMSRASSAILFQYNPPTIIDLFAEGGPKARADRMRLPPTRPPPTHSCFMYMLMSSCACPHAHVLRFMSSGSCSHVHVHTHAHIDTPHVRALTLCISSASRTHLR